jgi:hypothetical protein
MQRNAASRDRRRGIAFQHQPENTIVKLIVYAIGRTEIKPL